jgi:hypothetical protein
MVFLSVLGDLCIFMAHGRLSRVRWKFQHSVSTDYGARVLVCADFSDKFLKYASRNVWFRVQHYARKMSASSGALNVAVERLDFVLPFRELPGSYVNAKVS